MIGVPPFRGEFGLLVRYTVPAVAALPRPVVVCIEPGNEALFPDAKHIVVDRADDAARRDLYRKDADYVAYWREELERRYPGARLVEPDRTSELPMRRFVPEPVLRRGIQCDVVTCPRKRTYGATKNWPCWRVLADALTDAGLRVFAAGAPDASDTSVEAAGIPAAWQYDRFLDASIEAMLSARLVIATDAGLAHLAVLCGRPLYLIAADGGRVAPGPVVDGRGRMAHRQYWPIRLNEYYLAANHMNAPIEVEPDGWHHPLRVARRAIELCSSGSSATV